MKRYLHVAVLCAAGIILLFALTGCDSKALNVSDVASDPTAFKNRITITGIMAGVSPQDPSIFGIMDIKELQCKTQNCNKVYIPISYKGTFPVKGDEVRLTGSFVNQGSGFLFAAENMKVVRNHRIGG
jgi:hypothetical protein